MLLQVAHGLVGEPVFFAGPCVPAIRRYNVPPGRKFKQRPGLLVDGGRTLKWREK
jgi:hypothetical protein